MRGVLVAALLATGACGRDDAIPAAPRDGAQVRAGLSLSRSDAPSGSAIAIRLRVTASTPSPMVGAQGIVSFDPARLKYVGQPLTGHAMVIVNDEAAARGTLRIVSFDPAGLQTESGEMAFQVLSGGYTRGLRFSFQEAVTRDLTIIHQVDTDELQPLAVPASRIPPRRLTASEWVEFLGPDWLGSAAKPSAAITAYSPGDASIYGDATLDGQINVDDVASTSNLSVGFRPLLSDATKDFVIGANVAPFNLPGLGEADDPVPPGRNPDGSFTITVSDVAAISNRAVGSTSPVVGQPIPGRIPPPFRTIITGTLTADRTFFRDTVYELQGTVNVQGSVTLTIQAGTRIEGDAATRGALVIRRGGNIDARGTRLQPIVMTCTAPIKSRGCWGGLQINGFSLLNNGEMLPGGVDVNGCPQKPGPGVSGIYGGCLIADTSGVLRYVRIEYGGMAPENGTAVAGLQLLGVGTGTQIDSVQVFGSLGDGLFVSGGTAQIRYLLLTDNALDALHWEDGWVGKAQFLLIQQDADNDDAISGINLASDPNASPRSAPQIYHVTAVGPSAGPGALGRGIALRDGSAATIRDAVILRQAADGLDIDGAESCTQASSATPTILIDHSVFFDGHPNFSSDADCIDEDAYANDPSRANRVVDPGLLAPYVTSTADVRPGSSSPLMNGAVLPPSDGFFDLSANYIGAVAPANLTGTNIPWYAGWSIGF